MPIHDGDHAAAALTAESVRAALAEVKYPGLTRDLVAFGMVSHVAVCAASARVTLALRSVDPSIPARIEEEVVRRLRALGATEVGVEFVRPAPAPRPLPGAARDPWADQVRLASVGHIVAVGAGKGGVGKSTVAVNLALALSREGLRVGLLDADIHGPSLPILLGIEDGAARVRMSPEKHILPLEAHGLPFVSFGFFLGEGSPAVWRGPMVSKAVKQFARGVAWPRLDVLVVDLPPGTGDIPLSLAQAVALSGAVVVTQPARVAVAEARKAVRMFASLEVPVLGIVENMTGPFGSGGGALASAELGVPFLGEIPFDERVVDDGDAGTPTIVADGRSPVAASIDAVAEQVAAALGWRRESPVR